VGRIRPTNKFGKMRKKKRGERRLTEEREKRR
jgi:hypothetical protein